MPPMLVPVVYIGPGQVFGFDDQEVFSILLLSRPGEVKRPGDNRLSVDNHNLIVGDGMGRINIGRDANVSQEGGGGVFLGPLAFIHNGLNLYPPFMGSKEGLGYRLGSERIGLDQDFHLGSVDLPDNSLSATSMGAEIDLGGDVGQGQVEGIGQGGNE